MIKFTLSLLLSAVLIHTAGAQTAPVKTDTAKTTKKPDTPRCLKPRQLKLNFDAGGGSLSFEQRTDSVNSLYFSAGLQPHVGLGVSLIGPGSDFVSEYTLNAYATAGYRHYYNFRNRLKRKRNTANNSANFIAVDAGYEWQSYRASENADRNTSAMLRATWGIQRNLGKHFSYEVFAGAMLWHEITQANPYQPGLHLEPTAGFKIGYVLF